MLAVARRQERSFPGLSFVQTEFVLSSSQAVRRRVVSRRWRCQIERMTDRGGIAMELFPKHESKLIKDTTREQREEIVRRALRCSEGCENCTGCALGAGDAFEMYRPYIEGKLEIREINMQFHARYNVH